MTVTRSLLSRFKTEAVTQDIVDHGGELYRQWHPSQGIDVNDAMLAATVAATGGKIYTQKLKHYPMPDIAVLKGALGPFWKTLTGPREWPRANARPWAGRIINPTSRGPATTASAR